MKNRILISIMLIVMIAMIATTTIAVDKTVTNQRVKVTYVNATFNGERVRIYNTVCESDKSLDTDSELCSLITNRFIYEGKIEGFVNGKWIATGKTVNDRISGYGYTEGMITIFDENGKQVYKGSFQGVKEKLLTINEQHESETSATQVMPTPVVWKIEGSINLVGNNRNPAAKVFINFEAEETETTISGNMDGIMILKKPMIIPLPIETANTVSK
ncbi:MAG: hypothetical protein QXO27_04610 [Candidatus Aenigmatarchaeota archaeon]